MRVSVHSTGGTEHIMKKPSEKTFWSGVRWGGGVVFAVSLVAAGSGYQEPVETAEPFPTQAPATATVTETVTATPTPTRAPRTTTAPRTVTSAPTTVTQAPRTVTETREVVKIPDACSDYLEITDRMVDEIYAYEAAIAPQLGVVYDALGAIIAESTNGLNDTINRQNTILNQSTGPLQRITGAKPDMIEARAECQKALEED